MLAFGYFSHPIAIYIFITSYQGLKSTSEPPLVASFYHFGQSYSFITFIVITLCIRNENCPFVLSHAKAQFLPSISRMLFFVVFPKIDSVIIKNMAYCGCNP